MNEKYYFYVFIIILFMALLPVAAFAHPGSTDSNGGHIDHSTGGYHYHHGYPAHSHYDMDGDNKKDCPYNFDDQTSKNTGSSSHSSGKKNISPSDAEEGIESKIEASIGYGIFLPFLIYIPLSYVSKHLNSPKKWRIFFFVLSCIISVIIIATLFWGDYIMDLFK